MHWSQNYDPLQNSFLSTLIAGLPVVVLLGSIAILKMRIHFSALLGLAVALAVALFAYGMPIKAATATTLYGAGFGLFPIGWIILNLIFLYQLTVNKGLFAVLRSHLANLAPDPRIQIILIAFSFGAFFEGAAGFGTPVAVTAAILIQLGFKPLSACGLSLIANTAPVAYGALGTPILTLAKVTGLDALKLSAMAGRQLPFFSLLVPFWVVWAFTGWRGMMGVWPAAFVAGAAFALPQFLVANYHGPWLVDIVAAICSVAATALLLHFWKPKQIWPHECAAAASSPLAKEHYPASELIRAWMPWILLSALVFLWGLPATKKLLDGMAAFKFPVPFLHQVVQRVPPVAPINAAPDEAIYTLNILSATGTGILVAAILSGWLMKFRLGELARIYCETLVRVRFSLVTIAAMLALGYVTKYSGTDATLGLALAHTGALYPFCGTLLGWLGVALTGSDTASNVLFGNLQRISSEQLGLSPILMCAANSTGGVMGKMVDAQSIVVASTATNWYGHEGAILRYVFFHSLALAALVGILVWLQANVAPFANMVVR
ncbi:MAG: L-lactate permease [Verrucomicrobia bacterium]|nr:L-lactate permease [Verrucomicrobiota bacterium]